MLKLVLFGYSKGILSSRQIEKACRTNIVFMALCGDVHPDHTTIARFVTAHGAAVRQMFRDVLLIAAQGDLIGAELFALDGCKISSNAAKEHSGSHAELRKKIEKLKYRLAAMMEQHRSRDDNDGDADQDHPDPPQGVERYQSQIDRIKGFLDDHDRRIGVQGKEVKSNITDNESAKLKSGSGYIPDNQFRNRDQRFAERSRTRRAAHRRFMQQDFLYEAATDTCRCPADNQLSRYTRATVHGRAGTYYRADQGDCIECELAPRCLRKKAQRRHLFIADGPPKNFAQRMRDKIDAPAARRLYSKRMGIVEPVFGNITANKKMNRFTLRGRSKIRVQWLLFTLVHNIEKIATTGLIRSLAVP